MARLVDENMLSRPAIHEAVFEKVRLNVAHALDERGLRSLAANMRCQVVEDVMTRSVLVQFDTWMLGAKFQDVYFDEAIHFDMPATWWDSLKVSICGALDRRGVPWGRLAASVRWRRVTKRASGKKRVPLNLCPHVVVAVPKGELVHFTWMDGREEEAAELAEEVAWNGRT